jgi:hypothetical protein
MTILVLGRVLGGISTSLLFSAFESWMVSEHRKKCIPEELLVETFSLASWGNGVIAICAGFIAQLASDTRGDIGPFQVAIGLTAISLILIIFWDENTGDHSDQTLTNTSDIPQNVSFRKSVQLSLTVITKNPNILLLGLSQSFFEGAIYTFVFMWVPSLIQSTSGSIPTGLIFSCFMLSMTIGGILFSILLQFSFSSETLCLFVYIVSAIAMLVPVITFEFWPVFISFLVLETMLGMFNSCGAQLRSKFYPDNLQSSIMSVFRVPLNLLVVFGTKLSEKASDVISLQTVFKMVALMHVLAFIMHCFIFKKYFQVEASEDGKISSGLKKKRKNKEH